MKKKESKICGRVNWRKYELLSKIKISKFNEKIIKKSKPNLMAWKDSELITKVFYTNIKEKINT